MPLVRINPRRGRSTVGEGDERSPREVHRLHQCHRRHCVDHVKSGGGAIANTPAGYDCRQRQHLYRRKDLRHHARPRERRYFGTDRSARARDLGPGAIIFRSGEKLYIVAAPVLVPGARNQAGQNVPAPAENARPNRVTTEYVVPKSAELQELYGMLREHRVLEDMQGILSPFRLPEELTIKTTECGMVNSWYSRENSKPTVTICYELLRHILQSLPKKTTPDAITPKDAAVGQFFWLTTHEVGHAMFDLFKVPIFGHAEDAADNFAGYIMLQFGKERARRLIAGGAWAWRMYVADYRTNPIVKTQLAGFASNHGQPEERFYNLMCLAFGADPVTFADLTKDGYL